MSGVVLVTGVSRHSAAGWPGGSSADPDIDRVIGVDTVPPARADLDLLGRTEFVRADIRNPLIAKVLAERAGRHRRAPRRRRRPRSAPAAAPPMKEINVIGTMQLLAACQKSPTVQRLVVKSTTAVYGSSPRDPALFTEDTAAKSLPARGFAKDAVEVEGYVRGFARRRPDVAVSLLRFANFLGPCIDTPLARYFALPVVPTVFGFDPRLQFLHEDDAIEVLRLRQRLEDRPGTFNVAGDGVLLLSQAIRRAGRVAVPVPVPAVTLVGRAVRRCGIVDFSPEQMRFLELRPGRGHDPDARDAWLHAAVHDRRRPSTTSVPSAPCSRCSPETVVDAGRVRAGPAVRSHRAAARSARDGVGAVDPVPEERCRHALSARGDQAAPAGPRVAGARRRAGPAAPPARPRLGAQARRRAGVPAPPAHRRLRGRRLRLRRGAHRPGAAAARSARSTRSTSGSR